MYHRAAGNVRNRQKANEFNLTYRSPRSQREKHFALPTFHSPLPPALHGNARNPKIGGVKAFLTLTICFFSVTTPLLRADELLPVDCAVAEAVDFYVDAKMTEAGIEPAAMAADATLLRRTMLDLAGRIPLAAESQPYAANPDPKKRTQLVDRLLGDDFVRHTASELNTLLSEGRSEDLRPYLIEALAGSKGWDQMFREMVGGDTSQSSSKGPTSFVFRRVDDLDKLTNATSAIFLGINISCAKCHDHPLVSEWTQIHYYGMKSFFNRSFGNGDFLGERDYGAVQYKTTSGETRDARMMFLNGVEIAEPEWKSPDDEQKKAEKERLEQLKEDKKPVPAPHYSRRAQLVKMVLESDERQYLARSIVNRTWHRLMGFGLVMPLDQMHPENPASHPRLLDWLTRDFVDHSYDLKRLIRGIVLSRAYGRTSRWEGDGDRPAENWFAVAHVRALTPRQYATSLRIASRSAGHWNIENRQDLQKQVAGEEESARELASKFEQPGDDFQVSVGEALMFNNSVDIQNQLLADDGSMLVGQLKAVEDDGRLVNEAGWNVLGRPLEDEERYVMLKYLGDREDRRVPAIQQLVWAMLTGGEFRFNY